MEIKNLERVEEICKNLKTLRTQLEFIEKYGKKPKHMPRATKITLYHSDGSWDEDDRMTVNLQYDQEAMEIFADGVAKFKELIKHRIVNLANELKTL